MRPAPSSLTFGLLACGLLGCASQPDPEWQEKRDRLEREREIARQVLSDAAANTRQITYMPTGDGEADYEVLLNLEAQGLAAEKKILLYASPSPRVHVREDGSLAMGGGANYGGWSHGKVRSPGGGREDFAVQFRTSIGELYDSGAVFEIHYDYADNSGRSADLEVAFPVLWDVPVQMFYWPDGHIRVEIRPVVDASTRPATRPATRPCSQHVSETAEER